MKRYVKEFANDFLKAYPKDKRKEEKENIDNILLFCSNGLITDYEAMKLITDLPNKASKREESKMLIKSNITEKFDITMQLNIDWKDGYITIVVENYNKETNKLSCCKFFGEDFKSAIRKFEEYENEYDH